MTEQPHIPEQTLNEQYASSDPLSSAWVAANAGAGKTHVLTQRVIRLMLAGNPPDRILCLTFTKAAAANMKGRVFETLAAWTMMPDPELDREIEKMTGRPANGHMRDHARSLFAEALETPGGLKIQTIHSFCEALLRQFPLEANVPGHFETLQEPGQSELLLKARLDVLSGEVAGHSVMEHYLVLSRAVSSDALENALKSLTAMRSKFLQWIEPGIDQAMRPLYQMMSVRSEDTTESLIDRELLAIKPFREALAEIAQVAAGSDKKTDLNRSATIQRFFDGGPALQRFEALCETVLTKDGAPFSEKTMVTKFVKKRLPAAVDTLLELAEILIGIRGRINALTLLGLSRHLYHLAEAVLERYEVLKRRRGVIDFDDQIFKAANMLTRSDIREWIRYRLDKGIDHLLVDEAQDTSPRQWEIINAVTEDFHAGESAAIGERTIFVVGDEKQSIYSFQGADPKEFARQESYLRGALSNAGKRFHKGRLNLSFRSTPDVLKAVDLVFQDPDHRRGLSQSDEPPVHDAVRRNDPGEVHVWPVFSRETGENSLHWTAPVDQQGDGDPALRLARKICSTVKEWVGTVLSGADRPLRYGDILVLVRKRDRFITALTRVMKDAGLAVAGADRIVLTEHIAVEDLIAVGKFALLPNDDLNFACVLKSILFDISEQTLFELAHYRSGTLYDEFCLACEDRQHRCHSSAIEAMPLLREIHQKGNQLDVFEFYTWLLGPGGARKAFLARLGTEAEDALDAFLEEALDFVRGGGIGLERFIADLISASPDIKREVDLDRDEVRILTAHASKGLEARVVFLVDPGNNPWSEAHRPPVLELRGKDGSGYVWLPEKSLHTTETENAVQSIQAAAEEEYRRLLYVGMTRARDRLVVCGYKGVQEPKGLPWHAMVSRALEPGSVEQVGSDGQVEARIWRTSHIRVATKQPDQQIPTGHDRKPTTDILPDWLLKPAVSEPVLSAPLWPADAMALLEPEFPPHSAVPDSDDGVFAQQRGSAIHVLLESLPNETADKRRELAIRYLGRTGASWTPAQRASVLADVSRVLDAPEFSSLFEQPSRAEVAVMGTVDTGAGPRKVSGRIDRLVVTPQEIVVVDYKTGSKPANMDQVPHSYIVQLAIYRELVSRIYPDRPVRCALLWTREPELQFIAAGFLDEAIVKIREY